jgi:glutamate dehydrogenase
MRPAGRTGELREDGGVERLLAAAPPGTSDPATEELARTYWRMVPPGEVADREPEDLLTAVVSHRELAGHRARGEALLRLTVPAVDAASDRWAGGGTLIEIVTDDMPFLVDSVTAELSRHRLDVQLLVHPQLVVRRDAGRALQEVLPRVEPDAAGPADVAESWMHIEVDRVPAEELDRLRGDLLRVLGDVRAAVEDWRRMRDTATSLAHSLDQVTLPVPPEDVDDTRELLRWLVEDNFTFLGYREYRLTDGGTALETVPDSGLGILRAQQGSGRERTPIPEETRPRVLEQRLLVVTKANSRATVHRSAYLDYIAVKTFDSSGRVVGEKRFLGLFASAAYLEGVRTLPVIRRKVTEVLQRTGLSARSHSGKELLSVLETYPRDELFQSTTDELVDIVRGVLRLAGVSCGSSCAGTRTAGSSPASCTCRGTGTGPRCGWRCRGSS